MLILLPTVLVPIILSLTAVQGKEVKQCEALKPPPNAEIKCQDENSRVGRIIYTCDVKCKKYYTSQESVTSKAVLKIRCDSSGKWTNLQEFLTFSCREDCGLRSTADTTKPLVINGTSTHASTWPWHATLYRNARASPSEPDIWKYICGGSLVRGSVITAAHCVSDAGGKAFDPILFRIILGGPSSNYEESQGHSNAQTFLIRQIYISPTYDTRNFQGDIALISLGNKVKFNDFVLPICLPIDGTLDSNALTTGRFGDVVGFGVDETGKLSVALKHAKLMVASQSACFHSLKRIVSVAQFCAGNARDDESWVTVCNGDSGGGFAVPSLIRQRYHIHGIVSTGDLQSKTGICEKHAVFTRVFQFITWIRQTLEQINGEVIRELQSTANYPYTVHGTETIHSSFSSIPRHLDNLVTSVELVYTNLDAEGLLKSLEQNIGLQSLNLTHVKFAKGLPHRSTILPHLKSFVLDLPILDCWKNSGQSDKTPCINKDPAQLTRLNLKSLLFFDKFEMTDWPMDQLSHLGTNIELTLHTNHLIQMDHGSGVITLQIPFCSEVLENLAPDFNLRQLALRKCELDIRALMERRDGLIKIQVLVLDKINTKSEGQWSEFFSGLASLEHLVATFDDGTPDIGDYILTNYKLTPGGDSAAELDTAVGTTIDLSSLPSTLKSLAFANAQLNYNGAAAVKSQSSNTNKAKPAKITQNLQSIITFPEPAVRSRTSFRAQNPTADALFPELESFYCNLCTLDGGMRKNFASIVQFAKRLIFIGDLPLNITQILLKSRRLERIIFANVDPEGETSGNFIGLDRIPWVNPKSANTSPTEFSVVKVKGRWMKIPLRIRPELLVYVYGRMRNFYTSFEEFEADARLTSFEKVAYISGRYKFGKSVETHSALLPRLPRIPSAIRNNLKSVEIVGAEVAPSDLLDSLNYAYSLEFLILDKVRLLGYFVNFIELPNLRRYTLNAVSSSQGFFDQTSTVYGVNFYVPFSQTPEGSGLQTGLKRFDNIPIPGHPAKMERFEISIDDCRILVLDYTQGLFIATPKVGKEILPWLHRTNLTRIALRLSESDLGSLTLPQSVRDLDLRCKAEYEWHCSRVFPNLLQPLGSLSVLRVALHHAYDELYNRTTFPMAHIAKSAKRLELLGIEESALQYSPGITFPVLKEVIFDTCTFDPPLIRNFFEVFSAHTIALLSGGYDKYGMELEKEYNLGIVRIILAGLKNNRVKKIIGNPDLTLLNDTKEFVELSKHLTDALVARNERQQFMLERMGGGKWVQVGAHATSKLRKDMFDAEVYRLRGDASYGTANCIQRLFYSHGSQYGSSRSGAV